MSGTTDGSDKLRPMMWSRRRMVLVGVVILLLMALFVFVEPTSLADRRMVLVVSATFFSVCALVVFFGWAAGFVHFGSRTGRVERLFDRVPDAMAMVDGAGQVVSANLAYRQLLNRCGFADTVSPQASFAALEGATSAVYRLAIEARAGRRSSETVRIDPAELPSPLWLRIEVQPSLGDRRLVIWNLRLVDHPAAQFALEQWALDGLSMAARESPVGTLSVFGGVRARINGTLAGWLGYDPSECARRFYPLDDLVVDGAQTIASALHKSRRDAKSVGSLRTLDVDFIRGDRSELPLRLLFDTSDEEGGEVRAVAVPHEDPGMTSALCEGVSPGLLNRFPLPIASLSAQGEVLERNLAFATRFASLDATSLEALCHEKDWLELEARLGDVAGKARREVSVDIELKSDARRSARVDLIGSEGKSGGMAALAFFSDITEEKELARRLERAEKVGDVGRLSAQVAHDLNNALTVIIGYADGLRRENFVDGGPGLEEINVILDEGHRASEFVCHLLDYSRQQASRPVVIGVERIVGPSFHTQKRLSPHIQCFLEIDPRLKRPIKVDKSLIERVIRNLCKNAVEAMPKSGRLTVRAAPAADEDVARLAKNEDLRLRGYVVITVEDTGMGIGKDEIDSVFEPFTSSKPIGKGTGLGLASSKANVEQSGGRIEVASRVNEGTVFSVYLPFASDEDIALSKKARARSAKEERAKSPGRRNLTGNQKILLVEDEDALRSLAEKALAARGFEVHAAASGREALELVKAQRGRRAFDLVVSDILMPELSGPLVVEALRETMPGLRVLYISGYAEGSAHEDIGSDDRMVFLPKPFTQNDLVGAVRDALDLP